VLGFLTWVCTMAWSSVAPAGMVDVGVAVPDVVLDLRYAGSDHLTGAPIYPVARCLLAERVAARLATAAATLHDAGYRLVLWDCYRPFAMQKILWARVHDARYAAEPVTDADGKPVRGSVHSRGAAVDHSLADASGAILAMPTDHDDFSSAAHRSHRAADAAVRRRMKILDDAMTSAGFSGIATEWWHYDAPEGKRLPLRDDPLR
jgi:beta-N-acetylhexosaminidase/D-alanyl-D-alanine dipeptidase